MSSYFLAFGAGLLTTLSPCVLPVIPLVMGASAQAAKGGPLLLLLGMIASFSVTGTFAAAVLFELGLPQGLLANTAAIILILVGAFLALPFLDTLFKKGTSQFSGWVDQRIRKYTISGPYGQLLLGALIGVIWAPCTGPTLGAAIALASQGESLLRAFSIMLTFSVGAAIPMGVFGFAAKYWVEYYQGLMKFSQKARFVMALLFIGIGFSILFNLHKTLEASLLKILPEWWVNLIVSL